MSLPPGQAGAPPGRAPAPRALPLARAYLAEAASIAATMARYAASREAHGLRNGARAAGALAREIAGHLGPLAPLARPRTGEGERQSPRRCPICGWEGERFGPIYYVDAYREDTRCYGCGSTDRARLVQLYVERHLGPFFAERRRRVLDIGPLRYSRGFFPANVDYVSFDLVSPIATVRGDLCAAPFPDAYCDLWLCFHVLDMIPDDAQAMRELFRVLRPGGIGLLDNAMNWEADTEEYGVARPRECNHLRRYGRDLPDRLRALGFEVEIAATEDLLDAATRERCGILPRRILLCRRPA
jgi:SAM-dependent methyltransferase